MSNTTRNHQALIKAEFWSNELAERVMDETMIQNYVEWVDFPHGDKFIRPVIGDLDVNSYKEDEAVKYMPMDSGQFEFEITEYVQSGSYITNKARQDLAYAAQLESSIVPKANRAIQFDLEAFLMKQGQPVAGGKPHSQLADDANLINGYAHRFVGGGERNSKRVLDVTDFAKANLAFNKINVPGSNRIALVDAAQAYILETETNLVNFSDNPQWEGIVTTGLTTGKRFIRNIFGFDVYTTEFLPYSGVNSDGSAETIDGVTAGEGSIANLFFSAEQDMSPFIASWRQAPKVDGEYNKDYQREEYVVTARYGAAPQNRENLITVLTDDLANTAL